jgi:uncharacterized protein (UPF0261 family)
MRALKVGLMAAVVVVATSIPIRADYMVKEVGSFHVGGRTAALSGSEFAVEQMYVQFVKLARPKAKVPILLWHGGSLTGVTWETKPDGKPLAAVFP